MAKQLLDDQLWTLIEPVIPAKPRRKRHCGRKPIESRPCLEGILFVLLTGIGWEYLPAQFGCCGMTCWRRLRDWQQAGVWTTIHQLLLNQLREADRIDWSRAVADSASLRAVGGGELTGPNPTDRRKPGSKHHLLTDGRGLPLATILTGANVHDGTQLLPLIDAVPRIAGKRGAPRCRPECVMADKAYYSRQRAIELRQRGIEPMLPRRGTDEDQGLGRWRWVVERTLAWLRQFRRLRVRYEQRADIHQAFLTLGCILICFRSLKPALC